jgi:hypothetical protein
LSLHFNPVVRVPLLPALLSETVLAAHGPRLHAALDTKLAANGPNLVAHRFSLMPSFLAMVSLLRPWAHSSRPEKPLRLLLGAGRHAKSALCRRCRDDQW